LREKYDTIVSALPQITALRLLKPRPNQDCCTSEFAPKIHNEATSKTMKTATLTRKGLFAEYTDILSHKERETINTLECKTGSTGHSSQWIISNVERDIDFFREPFCNAPEQCTST